MTRLPRLTPHQKSVFLRLMRMANGRIDTTAFRAKRLARHPIGPAGATIVYEVGSGGALNHLRAKGYVRVVVDDPTTPIYMLTREALRYG